MRIIGSPVTTIGNSVRKTGVQGPIGAPPGLRAICTDLTKPTLICPLNLESPFVRVFSAGFAGWEERKTMKVSKFTDAQKAFILKQGTDGMPVADFPQGRDQPGDIFQLE
jgi:hypothetical protein